MNYLPKIILVLIGRCVIDQILIACLGCIVMNNPETRIKHKFAIKIRKPGGIISIPRHILLEKYLC